MGRRCHLSCLRGHFEQEVREGASDMAYTQNVDQSNPHGTVLDALQSPSRAAQEVAIRSMSLLMLMSVPTSRACCHKRQFMASTSGLKGRENEGII